MLLEMPTVAICYFDIVEKKFFKCAFVRVCKDQKYNLA